ncbi:cache domain-containing protein [Arcobacteraceae bacterium]|nr:cache domain-containing protein [Arcobacteraceae bacterium]
MFSEKNLSKLIIISPIVAIVLITFFTSYLFINTQYQTFEKENKRFADEFIQKKKDSLRNQLESIYNYLEHQESIYTANSSEKVIKRTYLLKTRLLQLEKNLNKNRNKIEILKSIINTETAEKNYFFAYDIKNQIIIQPDSKDIKKELKEDDKFFENYLYYEEGKLISFKENEKITFMLYIPSLDWIIGNIEDISSNIHFIRKVSKLYISTIKFDETGYSWVIDNKNDILNEEKSIIKFKSQAVEREDGFFTNYLTKEKNIKTLSYIKHFEEWDWVIGASLNLDYIKKSIALEKKKLRVRIEAYISSIIILAVCVMVFITILSIAVSNKISKSFKLYKDELLKLNKNLKKKIDKGIKEAQQKDRAMLHQSRLARLGTMISMIAHQWRQPLTEVSAILAELETATEFDKVNKQIIFDSVKESDKLIVYMSNTIDDFRMFFKPDKKKESFSLQKACNDAISLMRGTFAELDITLEKKFRDDYIIRGYPREFAQVILNILMNTKDAFIKQNIQNAKVKFTITRKKNTIRITIKDNAGGIKDENLEKIFEPYFSTKNTKDASGLGLFMSKMIIEKNMNGKLYVLNIPNGAQFNITFKAKNG